ncbi:MAG: lasso peptide biosynthesis B2 protein [candidate division NC10 bacterium]|nr:lasso peptide biosynthesis B2 protein [candidate division NC10 bacterium]
MKATRWSKLRSLSVSEVWFLVEAAAAVVAFDLALRLLSSKTCLALFESKADSHRRREGVNAQRMVWLVDVADRYAPGRSSCLRQAAALAWLLHRRGIATSLRIGVAREGDNLLAHSWLQSQEGELFGLSDNDKYAPLSSPRLPEPVREGSER